MVQAVKRFYSTPEKGNWLALGWRFSRQFDSALLFFIILFTVFGSFFFYGASAIVSDKLYHNPYRYFFDFFIKNVFLGFICFFIASIIRWKSWKKLSLIALIIVFVLLLLSFLPTFKLPGQQTARWFAFNGFSFQPSEFLKFFLILWLSFFFFDLRREFKNRFSGSLVLIFILVIFSVVIFLQPTLTNLLILWIGIFGGLVSQKPSFKEFLPFFIVLLIFVIVGFQFWGYRIERIKAKLFGADSRGLSFQEQQTRLAIGSGGLFGKGLGGSQLKLVGIPLMLSDSIFSVYAEETGFFGSLLFILFYLAFVIRIIFIGARMQSDEKKFFAFAFASWLSAQAFLHIASNTGFGVITGVPLPFFSYGASSQLAIMLGLGVINSLSRS
jgi:cell division protein FtsW